jgi:hypothetical protein
MYSSYYSNRFTYLFVITVFLFLVAISFGYFSGFVIDDEIGGKNDYKSIGLYLGVTFMTMVCLSRFLLIDISFRFPGSTVFYLLLTWLFFIMFFRNDLFSSSKNFLFILLTQGVVLLAANIFWRVPFGKLLDILIVFVHILMFISLILHFKVVGPLQFGNHEPEARMSGLILLCSYWFCWCFWYNPFFF